MHPNVDAYSLLLQPPRLEANGDLLSVGAFRGNLTLGGTTLSNLSGPDVFVAKFDGSSGLPIWLTHFESTGSVSSSMTARDPNGHLIIAGNWQGDLSLGGTTYSPTRTCTRPGARPRPGTPKWNSPTMIGRPVTR